MTLKLNATVVFGSWFDDVEDGSDGADLFVGGFGNLADEGNDLMAGGAGNDTMRGSDGADTLDGGAGSDRADYREAASGVVVDLGAGSAQDGTADDTLVSIEQAWGSAYADSLTGSAGADTLSGGADADTLDGAGGFDIAWYGDATAGVTVNLGTGSASGGAGADVLRSIEGVTGGAFADALTGDAGANLLDGGAGNDTLCGGLGDDTLVGGIGDDTALFGGTLADYRITALADGRLAVTDLRADRANTGTDTLVGIRHLAFTDQVLHLPSADRLVATAAPAHAVTALLDGSYVIAYGGTDAGGDGGVFLHRYSADGTAADGAGAVNTATAGQQDGAAVAALYDGGWVVAWHTAAAGGAIALQRFAADGSASGAELLVDGAAGGTAPAVTATIDGGFVVAWQDGGQDGGQDVHAQRFDAGGIAQGTVVVNTAPAGAQAAPVLAEQDNGCMAAWHWADGSGEGVAVRQFTWDGTAAGDDVRLQTAGVVTDVAIATLYAGGGAAAAGTVVTWIQDDGNPATADDAVMAQRFDASGAAAGSPVTVANALFQHEAAVTGLRDGGFIVVWDSVAADGTTAIMGRYYMGVGFPTGQVWQVNQGAIAGQLAALSVTEGEDGRVIVGWTDGAAQTWQQGIGYDGRVEFASAPAATASLVQAAVQAMALPADDGQQQVVELTGVPHPGTHGGMFYDIALM
ncbi:hemolysin type calcium-binding protein [Pseudoduganella flava]|uniref:Hemolysin type calcium-binding protein n=1 Tax=Pseudoduganella flava TaxID=871742 RepID=A0A562PJ09_9BURK|nr:calcium-binding protein [Pseudoduganella flava]QGZ41907.1 hypothetical protein GO485_24515 [Pseudoduganella flava]TWI44313.1 hemolysin type calcium-binding protein [Pseudoduganella flava]